MSGNFTLDDIQELDQQERTNPSWVDLDFDNKPTSFIIFDGGRWSSKRQLDEPSKAPLRLVKKN